MISLGQACIDPTSALLSPLEDLDAPEVCFEYMAWATRQFSKGAIDRAGDLLIEGRREDLEQPLEIINNWRACHSYPLHIIKKALANRAWDTHAQAFTAQRLKRLPSIATKLRDNPGMKLSQMQDIGGCRAVMPNITATNELISHYQKTNIKNPRHGRPIQDRDFDYIGEPKRDGYRSYHLVFRYQSRYADKQVFQGQRIEVQIRSKLQHAWATAVETVQTFTGHALKSKIKSGDPQWLRFFCLMGTEIARREKCPIVPGTPEDPGELVEEIRELSNRLAVDNMLSGWGFAVQKIVGAPAEAVMFLLVLDSIKRTLSTTPFRAEELEKASNAYLKIEKETEQHPEIQAVLVSVESIESLRAAYPNYYLDTGAFLDALRQAIAR